MNAEQVAAFGMAGVDPGLRAPTAAEVTTMVDETAKSIMRAQGRDPEVWERLPSDVRDDLRLLALQRLRELAEVGR